MSSKRLFIILLAIAAASFAGMLLVYPSLPEVVPTGLLMTGRAGVYAYSYFVFRRLNQPGNFRGTPPPQHEKETVCSPLKT